MAVKATEITEKCVERQMNLFKTEEWREYTQPVMFHNGDAGW